MSRSSYYQEMRELAHEKRAVYNLTTAQIGLRAIRKIYTQEAIEIFPCRRRVRNLKAAYYNDQDGCHVLLNMKLPDAPRLFAMLHELKHHYKDHAHFCRYNGEVADDGPKIEIGAEIFAGEFIFPETEFAQYVMECGITNSVTAEDVCRLVYHSPVDISYQFVQKRLEWLGLIQKGEFKRVQFHKLHEQLYGSRHYRQPRSRV